MNKIITIAKYTFLESSRKKIFTLSVFFVIFLLFISKAVSFLTYANQDRVLFDFTIASVSIVAILLTFYCGYVLFLRELESKHLSYILVKPIHRYQFIVGKYLGYLFSIYAVVLLNIILLYLFLSFQIQVNLAHLLLASFGILLNIMISLAFVVFFTILSSSFLSLILSFSFWLIANSHQGLKYLVDTSGDTSVQITLWLVKLISPDFALWNWKDNYYVVGFDVNTFILGFVIAILWLGVYLGISSWLFRSKDCA